MPGKLICLMRHSDAVAQLSDGVTRDYDRPLSDHGIHLLGDVRRFFKGHNFLPDLILCSPAVRTRQTLEWVLEALGTDAEVTFDDALYGISANQLIEKIQALPPEKSTVLVIGHNPSVSDAMQLLYTRCANNASVPFGLPARPGQLGVFHSDSNDWYDVMQQPITLDAAYEPASLSSL